MDQVPELVQSLLEQRGHPDHLDPAGGGSGTAPHEHDHQQHGARQVGPGIVVCGREPGAGEERGGLERAEAQCLPQRLVHRPGNRQGHQCRRQHVDANERAQFQVAEQPAGASAEGLEVKREVDRREQHEHGHHHVHERRAVGADAGRAWREAAGRDGAEGMGQRIEQRQPGRQQQRHLRHRQPEVHDPQDLGGSGDPRGELLQRGAGRLRAHQPEAADPEPRQDGDREYHDAHPAEPLRQTAPEQDRPRQRLQVGEQRRPGGGKPRHGFEEGVGVARDGAADYVRQGAESAHHQPTQHHHQETVAGQQRGVAVRAEAQKSAHRARQRNPGCDREPQQRLPLGVDQRHDNAGSHEQADQQQQCADGIDNSPGSVRSVGPRRQRVRCRQRRGASHEAQIGSTTAPAHVAGNDRALHGRYPSYSRLAIVAIITVPCTIQARIRGGGRVGAGGHGGQRGHAIHPPGQSAPLPRQSAGRHSAGR